MNKDINDFFCLEYLLKKLSYNFEVKISELCSFCWKSIFSKISCGSQDIIRNIPLELKQMTDYCVSRVKAVSQVAISLGKWQEFEIFLKILTQFFISFF